MTALDRSISDIVLIVDDVPENLALLHDALDDAGPLTLTRQITDGVLELKATRTVVGTVRLRYRAAGQDETERDVDVYGLAYRGGGWYAVGHCHLRKDLRSFRLDRVLAVEALPASFGRPEGFDVLGYLKTAIAGLPRAFAVEVLLHTDLATARRSVFVEMGLPEATPRGVRLVVQADDLEWVARELARLPFGFRIVKPAALKRALAEHARALLALAGSTG